MMSQALTDFASQGPMALSAPIKYIRNRIEATTRHVFPIYKELARTYDLMARYRAITPMLHTMATTYSRNRRLRRMIKKALDAMRVVEKYIWPPLGSSTDPTGPAALFDRERND